MINSNVNQINELVSKTSQILAEIDGVRQGLLDDVQTDTNGSVEAQSRAIQLILSYRLDAQDALVKLLNLDYHILYALGIQPQHTAKTNKERITFALGTDDLKQVLHALNQLVDYLLRIANRYQNQHQHRHQLRETKDTKLLKGMQKLVTKQKTLTTYINDLSENIEQLLKLEVVGPVYDHVAALQGPISKFHQAILHGLNQAQRLYQHANKDAVLDHTLSAVLTEADLALKNIPSMFNPQPHHQLGHFATKTSEELEQSAAIKRLRPFFS